jgi:putative hemolysin
MGNLGGQLLLVFVLILLNAAFAGSEIALVSLREGQLQRLEQRGRRGRALAVLARNSNRFLSTIQVGITLTGFLNAATAADAFADPLVGPLGFLGAAARPVSVLVVTLVLTYFTLVFGELVPKRLALQRAEGWALLAARPISLLAAITLPVVWVLTKSTDLTVRLLGGDPNRGGEEVTEEELRDMVAVQPGFTSEQRSIISGAFEIAERSVREILLPRNQVVALPEDTTISEAIDVLVESGHSRAPVYRDDLDNVLGVVHLRDLVTGEGDLVSTHARPAMVLPETVGVLQALQQLRNSREQLAIVINEHGGTEGIVTIEDLLEEIVGEIYDEFDRNLDPADIRGVQRAEDGTISLPGSFPMHDLPDINVVLPEGPYATVAGMVLHRLGRIPDAGEVLHVPGWRVEVRERQANAIHSLALAPQPDGSGDGQRATT